MTETPEPYLPFPGSDGGGIVQGATHSGPAVAPSDQTLPGALLDVYVELGNIIEAIEKIRAKAMQASDMVMQAQDSARC